MSVPHPDHPPRASMCFSATASIVTGVALIPAGAYCVATAARRNRAYLPLAVLPLLFGAQQFCEAAVWIGLQGGRPGLVQPAALGFLFFAVALWPVWIPLAAAALDERRGRRQLFYALAVIGLGFATLVYLPVVLYADDWLRVEVVNRSVRYDLSEVPVGVWAVGWAWQALYLTAVCLPLLLSADRRLWVLGIAVSVSAVITHVVFRYAFASIWCFFASLISLHICYVLYRAPRAGEHPDDATALPLGAGVVPL